MMLLQPPTWKATSQVASALGEGEPEGVGVAGVVAVVVLAPTEVVAEAAAGVVAGGTEGTEGAGGADLGLSVKAKAGATGQAKPAEQQLGGSDCLLKSGHPCWQALHCSIVLLIAPLQWM